jgi:hypothetical protein
VYVCVFFLLQVRVCNFYNKMILVRIKGIFFYFEKWLWKHIQMCFQKSGLSLLLKEMALKITIERGRLRNRHQVCQLTPQVQYFNVFLMVHMQSSMSIHP